MNRESKIDGKDDDPARAYSWLNALSEPAALLRTNGELVQFNRTFGRKFGAMGEGKQLSHFFSDAPAQLSKYLLACSSAADPLLGALHALNGQRFTCRGSRVSSHSQTVILLRLFEPDERFMRLTTTVRELNDLLRQREHEKAQLQEALRDRDVLHRELHHRVKNNLQMLAGLLHAAKTDNDNKAAKPVLEEAYRRFLAVATAHQSLYQLDSLSSVAAEPLVSQIAKAAAQGSEREVQIDCTIGDLRLSNDICTPLALIVNELVTNALKHARVETAPLRIWIGLCASGGMARLDVQDNGSGFHAPSIEKRGSGLGLVRGLVRQLRGKLAVDADSGTRFSVSFPLPDSK